MAEAAQPISILSGNECWELMSSVALGRLVTSVDGRPEIFPVNFVVQDRGILFRTAQGTKLVSAAINDQVLFEVDSYDAVEGWSVIVKGTACAMRTDEQRDAAEGARLIPWTSSAKQHFILIRPSSVTGRRFTFESKLDVSAN